MNSNKNKRVLVAMSGGVDSSVAAIFLKNQGYTVIGATMQVWDYSQTDPCDRGTCCANEDVDDARAVCDQFDIPFYVINCEKAFHTYVINPFIESYLKGETPVPCTHCNSYLKFDLLIQKMKELNCDYLATGHYAQIKGTSRGQVIVTSQDSWKDQTYFLFSLRRSVLPHLMFPVGDWSKDRVREYAKKHQLAVHNKKDSTGICFIGKQGYSHFIESHTSPHQRKPGVFKNYPEGQVLGEHTGIHQFTYGQRRGLGVHSLEPLYVIKIEAQTGAVWLGEEKHLHSHRIVLEKENWLIPIDDLGKEKKLKAKIRFHHKGGMGVLKQENHRSVFYFDEPQRAVTPGQAIVFYDDQALMGGAWIDNNDSSQHSAH